uniref:Ankyrin repeat protein n=1 Tax=Globisporangium ultimum (strain ATCC 200006 / CBS 805.95 / DAOM BR144) TaxID=431595 RepID=K3WMG9_GLOUD
MCKLEWLDEDDEEHIYGPADVVESRHDIDPYLCAVEALDTLVLGYSKWNIPNPDTSSAAVPASDFSELIAQRMESELSALNNITAVGKPGIAAASKKKIDVSKPAVIGEGVACSVLEKSIELVQLAPSLSDKFPLVSNAVLQLLVHLMRLPGGIKAMLYLAKAGVTPGSKPLGEGSEKIVETRPSSTCPMLTLSTHFSAWPLSSEQSQRTQHALLLKPFLYVLESVYTTFSEVDSAAEALDVLTSGDDINTAVVYTHSATIGSTTIELPISQSDVFVNVAASIGALVRVISFADDSRMADCPSNPTQRLKLADKVESLALRLINFGREKQDVAIAKYKHLSEAADTNQTSPSTGAASSSPSEYVNISTMKLPEFPYMAQWAKAILNLQVDVLRFAYENYSAILLATELSNNKLALALLAAGASPDAASVDGTMPLMTALLTGNDELVRELLCFGANVDTMTVDGNDISVWSCALVSPLGQNVNQMISSAYEIKCAAQGMSLLMELDTVWGSPTFLASCLATKQLDVNVSNVDGNFLLHAIISKLLVRRQIRGLDVCMRYHSQKMERIFLLETVTALLETHGADANACNRLGQTPLHLALKFGHTEIAQCLLRHGANPNTQDSYGYLPLHYACLGFCASEVKQSTGSTLPNPLEILDEILASASKFELVAGKHSDLRKHKLPYEKNALAIETILEDGFVDATSPKAITTKVASVQQILTTAGFSDGLLPWHFACGGCSQVTSTICLDDDMRARFQSNGAARAAILTYFKQKHGADLREKANKNMTALHFALKTNISGCNADVVDVLLDSANCREQINDVHDHSTIDTLPPIPEGSQVDVLTANLHAIHCSVSSRSFDSKYHIILPNGDHLEDLQREQVQPSDRNSSVPAACGVKTKYLLLMESAFSPLHYALQSSDDMALRLLSFSDLSLDPDGSDLPLLALACVARRSAEVVSKLITQQVNMRVHLPLLGAQRDVIANQIAICNLASRKNAAALHFAVLYEDVDVVRVLVENKEVTNVNVRRSGDGFTPLHLACEMSHMELIKLLLDHGANLLQMSTLSSSANGVTPLQLLLKNDTPGNEQLKSLVAAKYLRREMLIEDLGTPLLTHRSSPGTARGESMVREPSYTDLDVDGSSIDADGDGIALSTKSKEQGITCMLLAIEEHNLSLYTRLSQLRENQREGQALGRRLLKDLEKSDDALHVLFQLFVDEPKLPPSFSAAQVTVLEERNANDVHSDRQQLPLRTVSFESIEHRHECYRQKIVRSKWIPPRPPTVMRRVSSMNAEVSPPKRKLSNSETPPENPSGPASAQST